MLHRLPKLYLLFCTYTRLPGCFAHLLFQLWTFSVCIHCNTKQTRCGFYLKFFLDFQHLRKIEFCWRQIFWTVDHLWLNLPRGHVKSHTKFGPNLFSHFNVYWIQTNRQAMFIHVDMKIIALLLLDLLLHRVIFY